MPTLLIAERRQEVSSFNPVPSHYTDFDVLAGDALIDHRRVRDEICRAQSCQGRNCRYYPKLTQGYYPEIDPPPTLAEGRIANGIVVVI